MKIFSLLAENEVAEVELFPQGAISYENQSLSLIFSMIVGMARVGIVQNKRLTDF